VSPDRKSTDNPPPMAAELLRQLFAAAPSAMLMVAADGTIRLANRAAEALFGFGPGELAGHEVDELVPPRFRSQHPRHRSEFFARPATRAMGAGRDLYGLRRDGSEVPIEIGLNPIATADGTFVLAAIVDLSQRKHLEESLRQSEERLRSVVESAPNAMIMVGEDGAIVLVNSQAEALFGWPREQLLGQPIEVLVPERFRAGHPGHRQHFFGAPTTRAMGAGRDLFGLRRDGSEVPIEIGLNPIRTPDGLCVLAAIIDITHRKQAEAHMRRSLQEKETLLREIHHRVKNNMQLVSSMLSLQSSCLDEPRYQAVLEACRGRVKSMALIHEKLYLGENLATIDFDDYVRELAMMLANSQGAVRGVEFAFDTEPITLHIDTAIPLGLILNELVTNAYKHAFAGQRTGRIVIALQRRGDDRLELGVADDGVGLPESFDARAGVTLGLRVIHSLARQLDGELVIERTPRTHFRLLFPVPAVALEES